MSLGSHGVVFCQNSTDLAVRGFFDYLVCSDQERKEEKDDRLHSTNRVFPSSLTRRDGNMGKAGKRIIADRKWTGFARQMPPPPRSKQRSREKSSLSHTQSFYLSTVRKNTATTWQGKGTRLNGVKGSKTTYEGANKRARNYYVGGGKKTVQQLTWRDRSDDR